jgi:hypothetical protein
LEIVYNKLDIINQDFGIVIGLGKTLPSIQYPHR